MLPIMHKLGFTGLFTVDNTGHSGGLALIRSNRANVTITSSSKFFIDATITLDDNPVPWRFTGYYGQPERNRRRESWDLMRLLATQSSLPWLIIGDFNDIRYPEEKSGNTPHPQWLFRGFNEAIDNCGLKEVNFDGYQFTWERSRGSSQWIEEKLDRILASDTWFEMFNEAKACSFEAPASDHRPLALWPIPTTKIHRRRKFKFENLWIKESRCREVVLNSWVHSHGLDLQSKLELCSRNLWNWGRHLIKNFQPQIDRCKSQLEALRHRRDPSGIRLFDSTQRNYILLLDRQNQFWRQRAKSFWLQHGDTNSKFFHNQVRSRRRANALSGLRDNSGNWVPKGQGLHSLILNHFTNIFDANPGNSSPVLDCIPNLISQQQNAALLRTITHEEVRRAAFSMHPDKSPGPDGFNPGFYQAHWDIVGHDITTLCKNFLSSGKLPHGLNNTQIVLIPKKPKPEVMGDLRPIALCNVAYKILAKVLANRLKVLLDKLISASQSAFIPGRLISDNIIVAHEILHFLKRKNQGKDGYVALKIDISKAFDRVEWSFLYTVMAKMGFSPRWINLILECISSVKYTVLHEGDEIGPILPTRGLRQGDPISPYLFIIIVEGLSAMIKLAENQGNIHGVAISRSAPKITHLLFADDSYFFFKASPVEANTFKTILDIYSAASGQIINFEKSALSFSQNVNTSL